MLPQARTESGAGIAFLASLHPVAFIDDSIFLDLYAITMQGVIFPFSCYECTKIVVHPYPLQSTSKPRMHKRRDEERITTDLGEVKKVRRKLRYNQATSFPNFL